MQKLLTVRQMCDAWGMQQCVIAQITKNMTPVEYIHHGIRRSGLYSAAEVAAEIAEDTENKLRRAQKTIIGYQDRLRRLSPFLQD